MYGISEPLAKALVSRGIVGPAAEFFLRPTLKALFPDPSSFADMDRAAQTLVDVLSENRNAVVFADYDLPGLQTVEHVCVLGSEKAAWFLDPEGNILCLHEDIA